MITYALAGMGMIGRSWSGWRTWARRHKWWSRVVAIVVIDLLVVATANIAAYAAGSGSPVTSPFLPGASIHDSGGVPLSYYTVLPLDRGGAFDWGKAIVTAPLDFLWTIHLTAFAWMIWLCQWVISFQWMQVIVAPFQALADLLQQALGRLDWIPFALAVTAGVAGLCILAGKRVTSSWVEMGISALLAFLAVTMLANPVATLTRTGGVLDTAQSWGSSLAAAVSSDDIGKAATFTTDDVLTESVTTQLVDMFVKLPAETLTFGHPLSGACEKTFEDTMRTAAPVINDGDDVRNAVSSCDAAAKTYVENPNFGAVIAAMMMLSGGLAIFVFPIVLLILFFSTVIKTLVDALKTMWNVYKGILPVNRHALWSSLGGMFMGAATIVFLVVLMAAALRVMVAFLTGLAGMGIPITAVMMLANVFLIVLLVILVRAKRAAKRAGDTMADHLSRFGLSSGSRSPQSGMRSLAVMSMASSVASAALRRPNRSIDSRSINFNAYGGGPLGGPKPVEMTARPVDGGAVPLALAPSPRPAGPGPSSSTSQPAGHAAKGVSLAVSAARIAKGAAGGIPGLAGAAALEVGGRVASKAGGKALSAATSERRRSPRVMPPEKHTEATFRVPSRRIVVDASGAGHILRPAPVHAGVSDITSMPSAPRTARNERLREQLLRARSGA